jgi:hypothetical protein
MIRRVGLVRTDVSEEFSASIIRVKGIGELGTLAVTSNRRTLVTLIHSSETSFLSRVTRRNIPEDASLHSYGRGNLCCPTLLHGLMII